MRAKRTQELPERRKESWVKPGNASSRAREKREGKKERKI